MKSLCIGTDRRTGRRVWLRPHQLFAHALVSGGTGMGKSQLANLLGRYSLNNGVSAVVLDPHGDVYHDLVAYATVRRLQNRLVTVDGNEAANNVVFPLNFSCRMAWIRQHRHQ